MDFDLIYIFTKIKKDFFSKDLKRVYVDCSNFFSTKKIYFNYGVIKKLQQH